MVNKVVKGFRDVKVVKVVRGILPYLEKLRKIKDSSRRRACRKIL